MSIDVPSNDELSEPTVARSARSAQENAVGISIFASTGSCNLQCIFKQRYTDFQVNEISSTGKVIHLTEIAEAPSKKRKLNGASDDHEKGNIEQLGTDNKRIKTENGDAQQASGGEAAGESRLNSDARKTGTPEATVPSEAEISDAEEAALETLFGDAVTKDILKLYKAILTHPSRKARDHMSVKSEVIESKATRTQAHLIVRRIFGSKLETATLQDEPGRMSIRAAAPPSLHPQNGTEGSFHVKKARVNWDELGGDFLHFTLYKENKDTMEVLYFLASQLKMKVNIFSYAGTKDRRGVTVQRIAAHRVTKERLQHLSKLARGWHVGDFEYKKHGLELGELEGNDFVITLRDCRTDEPLSPRDRQVKVDALVRQAAADLGTNGYINYYGLQRFGSFQTGTHIVGMKMLQGDLKGAIDSILSYDTAVLPENIESAASQKIPQDDIDRAEAIRIWQTTGNVSKARDRMPKRFQAESNIITYLGRKADGHKQDKDWQGALMCIQRGLRLMYVHAYQSFVWNKAAVKRRELYGGNVVEGDLVVIGEKDGNAAPAEDKTDQDGELVVHPTAEDGSAEDAFVRARPLSRSEVDSGVWDIFDVVLPLPGWDAILPANEVGKFYEEFMGSEEGGRLDPHNMRRTWKDASLSGGYRKMMSRPLRGRVDVTTRLYTGEEQLAETDADRLRGQSTAPAQTSHAEPKVAVVLKMQLGSSQYATMALRELTKGGAIAYKPEFSAHR